MENFPYFTLCNKQKVKQIAKTATICQNIVRLAAVNGILAFVFSFLLPEFPFSEIRVNTETKLCSIC
jgi:hypothetical protein